MFTFWIFISMLPLFKSQYYVTTLSGSGAAGYLDGVGTLAEFRGPISVFLDATGNCYVTDAANNRIRKISPTGYVTTVAGNGIGACTDGQDIQASFYGCDGLSINSLGNVIVSDNTGHKIRSINASGYVSTIAGNGAAAYVDGPGISASFNNPAGLAIDPSNNIYLADFSNHVIRKVNRTGYVTTVAGTGSCGITDGQGVQASFCSPTGVSIDHLGNIFVLDFANGLIRQINTTGYVSRYAGGGTRNSDGPAQASKFYGLIVGIAFDYVGNLYVSDTSSNRIKKINMTGYTSTIAGKGTPGFLDGEGKSAAFNMPEGLAIDRNGSIYVSDLNNNRIRKIILEPVTSTTTVFTPISAVESATSITINLPSTTSINSPISVVNSYSSFTTTKTTTLSASNNQVAFSASEPALIAMTLVFTGPTAYVMIALGSISGALYARYRIGKEEEKRLRDLYSKKRKTNLRGKNKTIM